MDDSAQMLLYLIGGRLYTLGFVDGVLDGWAKYAQESPKSRASLEMELCNLGSGMWRCELAARMTLLCP